MPQSAGHAAARPDIRTPPDISEILGSTSHQGVTVHSEARFFLQQTRGELMTYRVFYRDTASVAGRDPHVDKRVRSEHFSTEHEALRRARELLEEDPCTAVAVHDQAGNQLHGVRLQLKLGLCCE